MCAEVVYLFVQVTTLICSYSYLKMLASYVAIIKVHIAEVLANQYIHLLAIATAIYYRNQVHAYMASYVCVFVLF